MTLTNQQKRARNAEYQRRWWAKHKAELRALREQARAARQPPDPATIGHLIETLIEALNRQPRKMRAQAVVALSRRLGLEVEEVATHDDDDVDCG